MGEVIETSNLFYYMLIYVYMAINSPACVCVLSHFSHVQLFATPSTRAHQAPLSM